MHQNEARELARIANRRRASGDGFEGVEEHIAEVFEDSGLTDIVPEDTDRNVLVHPTLFTNPGGDIPEVEQGVPETRIQDRPPHKQWFFLGKKAVESTIGAIIKVIK